MVQFLKVHLVFPETPPALVGEISKYCHITGKDTNLEAACSWAIEGSGAQPDIFLINCGASFVDYQNNTVGKRKLFLDQVRKIKISRPNSRLVLLLPDSIEGDAALVTGLLKQELYDFWYLDTFDETDIISCIFTIRSLAEVEEYLKQREKSNTGKNKANNKYVFSRNFKKIYQPHYVKSNIIAFSSDDDSLLNYAIGIFTAFELARMGIKVALIEPISSIPRLAGCLSISHPFFNIRHALTMYAQQNNLFIKNCLFNKEIYLADRNSPAGYSYVEEYPANFYMLPDGMRDDNLSLSEIEKYWPHFVEDLVKTVMFEKDFSFLIFICQGHSRFNEVILSEYANIRYLTVNMLPGSIIYGMREIKRAKGKISIISNARVPYINNQLRRLGITPVMYPPAKLAEEFLEFVYIKKMRRLSQDTMLFINKIIEVLGIKNDEEETAAFSWLNLFKKIWRF